MRLNQSRPAEYLARVVDEKVYLLLPSYEQVYLAIFKDIKVFCRIAFLEYEPTFFIALLRFLPVYNALCPGTHTFKQLCLPYEHLSHLLSCEDTVGANPLHLIRLPQNVLHPIQRIAQIAESSR